MSVTAGDVQQIINTANQAIYNIQGNVNYTLAVANNSINNTYYNAVNGINGAISNLNYNVYGAIGNINNQISNIANQVNYRINVSNDNTVARVNAIINNATGNSTASILSAVGNIGNTVNARIAQVDTHIGTTEGKILGAIQTVAEGGHVSTEEFKKMLAESTKKLYETAYIATNNAAEKIRGYILDSLDEQVRKLDATGAGIRDYLNDHLAIVNNTIVSNTNLRTAELQRGLDKILSAEEQQGNFFESALKSLLKSILDGMHTFLVSTDNQIEGLFDALSPIINKLKNNSYRDFDDLIKDLHVNQDAMPLIKVGITIFSLVPVFNHLVNNGISSLGREVEQLSNVAVRGSLLDIDNYVRAYFQRLISEKELTTKLNKYGLTDADQNLYIISNAPRLDFTSLQNLFLRGEITENQLNKELELKGFNDADIKRIKSLYKFLPQPQDLITMAVREVFSPETAKEFGQYEDFPEKFAEYAEKIGISKEWAERYWAAHWQLPSPQMGFEMFQRRIINKNTLVTLLKALDIMPYWREKLIQLNYNPLTRVDVRRMYGEGILTKKQVYEAYLDVGYSPENAELMRDFTVKYESDDIDIKAAQIRSMTKTTISNAYRKGVINRPAAKKALIDVGYSANDAEFVIDLVDMQITIDNKPDNNQDFVKRTVSLVKSGYGRALMPYNEAFNMLVGVGYTDNEARTELSYEDYEYSSRLRQYVIDYAKAVYSENTVDINDLKNTLRAYGFSNGEMDKIINEANVIANTRSKKPTLADVIKFYKGGLLTDEQFISELQGLGYADKYVWYYYLSTVR